MTDPCDTVPVLKSAVSKHWWVFWEMARGFSESSYKNAPVDVQVLGERHPAPPPRFSTGRPTSVHCP
jgi:hypothetical protein